MPEDRKDRREKMAKEAKTNAMRMLDRQKVNMRRSPMNVMNLLTGSTVRIRSVLPMTSLLRLW